jgi:CHAD domain-containing protein
MMEKTLERELKLEAGEDVELEQLGGTPRGARTFTSVYYDTAERRLSRLGITLRRRTENGVATWQLKVPRSEGRLELEEDGGPADAPSRLRALLVASLRDQAIEPVATLRTRRRGRLVRGVEVTLDAVEVLEGQHVIDRFAQIEAELVEGPPESLRVVGRELRKSGARPSRRRTKVERVVADGRADTSPAEKAPLARLRGMIFEQFDELMRHDPSVRLGGDPEAVHDMRVAVRRLRSVLRSTKPMLDEGWVDELREELDWLAQALGAVRDLDVLSAHLEAEIAQLDAGDAALGGRLLEGLRARYDAARGELLATLESDRYLALLAAVEGAAEAPRVGKADVELSELAATEFRRLRRRVRGLPSEPSAAALHKTRIRGKRARYAAELAGRSDGASTRAFVAAAKTFQDVLGEHQDAIVAETTLRELSRQARDREAALVAGRLIEREQRRRAEARAAFPHAWKRLKRRGRAAF